MLVVDSINEGLKDCLAAATEPGEVCIWFPYVVSLGIASPLDLELGCACSLVLANYALDIVFDLAGVRHIYWWGWGLGAAVIDLVALELSYIVRAANEQVL